MNRLPSRKVIFFIVILLIITLGVLWYVGSKNRAERERREAEAIAEIINKNESLRNIVEDNLEKKGGLQSFDPASLFENNDIQLDAMANVTAADLQTYAERLVGALKPISGNRKHEVRIMLEAMDSGDRTMIQDVVSARLTFDSIADNLAKIPTPAETATFQKDLIISLQKLSALAAQMEKALDEPILALQSGNVYLAETANLINLADKLNNYLQQTGVVGPEYKIVITFEKDN